MPHISLRYFTHPPTHLSLSLFKISAPSLLPPFPSSVFISSPFSLFPSLFSLSPSLFSSSKFQIPLTITKSLSNSLFSHFFISTIIFFLILSLSHYYHHSPPLPPEPPHHHLCRPPAPPPSNTTADHVQLSLYLSSLFISLYFFSL